MYRFIVLYVCIYVAPGTCEARHFVPLYVHTCSGMTIKLNVNLNLKYTTVDLLKNQNQKYFNNPRGKSFLLQTPDIQTTYVKNKI